VSVGGEVVLKHACLHCGHSPDVHRFDDDRLVEVENAGTPWEERPFRCLGPHLRGCEATCPDFLGQPISIVTP
jgi:hypothetical protein